MQGKAHSVFEYLSRGQVQVACEAMARPEQAVQEGFRKDYHKLIASLEARESILTAPQKYHLGCWKLWVLLRLQLFTDDSFVFSKVARNVSDLIEQLPDVCGEAEEKACEHIKARQRIALALSASQASLEQGLQQLNGQNVEVALPHIHASVAFRLESSTDLSVCEELIHAICLT